MPSLRQLHYLISVAETGHFGKAAEKLHVTQPTLSMQLGKLERELGCKLLHRLDKRVLPTPIGRSVLAHARNAIAEVRQIKDLTQSVEQLDNGLFHLGVSPTLGPYLLPSLIASLHRQWPQLKLSVREDAPAQLEARLSQGELDLVIAPLPIHGQRLHTLLLFEEPLLLAVSPDHPLAEQQRVPKSMLKGQRILAMESGYHLHEQVAALCDEYHAELLREFEGTSLDTLRHMAGMGLGMAFLPALYVHSEIAGRNDVHILRLAAQEPYRQIGVACRRYDHGHSRSTEPDQPALGAPPFPGSHTTMLQLLMADLVSDFIAQFPDLRRLHKPQSQVPAR